MVATALDLSQIKTDALSSAATFRTLIGLGTGDAPTFAGTTLTGGTVAVSTPLIDATQTWNDAGVTFTGMKLDVTDTASAAGSLLMDLQVGGNSQFKVDKESGTFVSTKGNSGSEHNVIDIHQFAPDVLGGYDYSIAELRTYVTGGRTWLQIGSVDRLTNAAIIKTYIDQYIATDASGFFGWVNGTPQTNLNPTIEDLRLYRDAANTLAQRNGTNAQTFNLYNTYTDASNYERGFLKWDANVFTIGTEAAGTGTARNIELDAALVTVNGDIDTALAAKIRNINSSSTVPVFIPNDTYSSTGLGGSANYASIISAGVEGIRVTSSAVSIFQNATFAKSIVADDEPTDTPTGTTSSIALNDGNHQTLSLGSATGDVTLTFTVPSGSAAGTIIATQGATARDITFAVSAGSIVWLGTEPTWNADTNKTRIISWRYTSAASGTLYLTATETN